jgi:hypothetical protein
VGRGNVGALKARDVKNSARGKNGPARKAATTQTRTNCKRPVGSPAFPANPKEKRGKSGPTLSAKGAERVGHPREGEACRRLGLNGRALKKKEPFEAIVVRVKLSTDARDHVC